MVAEGTPRLPKNQGITHTMCETSDVEVTGQQQPNGTFIPSKCEDFSDEEGLCEDRPSGRDIVTTVMVRRARATSLRRAAVIVAFLLIVGASIASFLCIRTNRRRGQVERFFSNSTKPTGKTVSFTTSEALSCCEEPLSCIYSVGEYYCTCRDYNVITTSPETWLEYECVKARRRTKATDLNLQWRGTFPRQGGDGSMIIFLQGSGNTRNVNRCGGVSGYDNRFTVSGTNPTGSLSIEQHRSGKRDPAGEFLLQPLDPGDGGFQVRLEHPTKEYPRCCSTGSTSYCSTGCPSGAACAYFDISAYGHTCVHTHIPVGVQNTCQQ